MRRTFAFAILLTAACSSAPPAIAEGTERVACALDGAGKFTPKCALERGKSGGKPLLIVRHPDGGFRRFEVTADGRELRVADGADRAELALIGKALVVRIEDDAYRFALPLTGNAAR